MKKGCIKDLCDVIAGQSPKGSAYNKDQKGIEFHQGKIAFGDLFREPSGVWTTEITKLAQPNDILMSVRAPVGPTNLTNRQICIGRGLAAIRCKKGVMPRYILYALKRIEKQIVGNDGAVFNSINKKQIEELPVLIAPLSEQERIVSLLDEQFAKIDALKANAATQLQAAKDLFQSALKQLLTPQEGWEEKKLGEICEIARGGSPRPIKDYITNAPNSVNWIKIGDTDPAGKYIYETKEKIKPEGIKKSRWVEKNDFILSNSMSFGRPYILKTNGCIHDGWLVLRNYIKDLYIDFFYYVLTSPDIQHQLTIKAQGSTVSNLNTDRVASVSIPVPPLPEQERIAARLDTISEKVKALQANYDQTINLCNDLKQALLKSIFA